MMIDHDAMHAPIPSSLKERESAALRRERL
jgi:hypothetical protein